MPRRRRSTLPVALQRAARRLDSWRAEGPPRRPLPAEFWDLSAELAEKYGPNRTASALRLDYYCLKKRIERSQSPTPAAEAAPSHEPAFLEIVPGMFGAGPECVVEMEAPERQMRWR